MTILIELYGLLVYAIYIKKKRTFKFLILMVFWEGV